MTCETCGEGPKKDRHFPSAVVEINNPESLVLLRKVVISASLGDDTTVPPVIGKYRNVILQYEANGHLYLYSSDGIPTSIESNVPQEVLDRITTLETDVTTLDRELETETGARERADGVLQQEIDDLKNSPDVVDIVATYADLMAYDTSSLGDKDVIRVLADETHEGQSAYYRWSTTTQTWTFIGTVGNYYTKDQIDSLLDGKQDELTPGENVSIVDESGELVISAQDTTYTAGYGLELNGTEFSVDPDIVQDTLTAGDNITIEDESGSLVISATDTTYSAGSGLNLTGTTFSVDTTTIPTQSELTAALADKQDILTAGDNITIADESGDLVISATDTTYTAGAGIAINNGVISATSTGPTVVQTTGTSTTDVMSQNAVTSMIYQDPTTKYQLRIGNNSSAQSGSVAIGMKAMASASDTVAIGADAKTTANGAIAIGYGAKSVSAGQFDIGLSNVESYNWTNYGYNHSQYRLLTGLYDPQSAHDAATKGYIDTALTAKQDELTAGTGISIAEESGALVISATGAEVETINAQDWSNLWQ